jgi:hypothetical protein
MPLNIPGYTELRELGSGATGRVVVVRYDSTGQLAAAKILSPQLLADKGFRERFRREAEILAQVRHPNVVSLYGYADTGTDAVILMELLDGISLEKVVERGPIEPEAALVVLSGALLGLDAAHRVGVVHRDVKPANILVETQGGSHLLDFGVAVMSGQPDVPAGTPVFMAPEQWQGLPATPQTDVYAATGVYYQCVTGRWPFPAQTVEQLRQLHLQTLPDVASLPLPIGQLVLRGMAKDPAQRPATAGAFHEDLERAAVAVHGPDWRRRGTLALGGAAGAFAAAFPLAVLGHGAVAGTGSLAGAAGAPGALAEGAAGVGAVVGGGVPTGLIAVGAAALVVAATVGGLAATHRGPFSSSPTASTVSSSSSTQTTPASSSSSSQSVSSTSPSSSSSSTAAPGVLGASHNPLFPAAPGNTWTYRTSSGNLTQTVQSATPAAGGANVVLSSTTSAGNVTNTFLFTDAGQITASQFAGSGTTGSTSGVLFTIPSKDDIVAGMSFSNTGTIDLTGSGGGSYPFTSTSKGAGTESVTVPAGTFNAYKLSLTITVTIPQSPTPTSVNETIDLVENVGIVRETSDFGNEELLSSNLVHP